MNSPTLSAVMPNYNHARFLPAAIESILGQTRPPDEFLILDDASTDNSVSVIESYASRYPIIRLIRNQQNQGVIAAHQRLFDLAAGTYLYSGAADDERYPRFFELAMAMAEKHPAAGFIFGKMVVTNAEGIELGEIAPSRWRNAIYAPPDEFREGYLEVETPWHSATAATVFRREALREVGWFRPELGSFTDTFATRAIGLKYGACYVPERFCAWRKMSNSVSQSTNRDGRRALDIAAKAYQLMRSDPFRERFPADYVDRWWRRQRRQILWSTFLGEEEDLSRARPGFVLRNLARLKRIPAMASLYLYGRRRI